MFKSQKSSLFPRGHGKACGNMWAAGHRALFGHVVDDYVVMTSVEGYRAKRHVCITCIYSGMRFLYRNIIEMDLWWFCAMLIVELCYININVQNMTNRRPASKRLHRRLWHREEGWADSAGNGALASCWARSQGTVELREHWPAELGLGRPYEKGSGVMNKWEGLWLWARAANRHSASREHKHQSTRVPASRLTHLNMAPTRNVQHKNFWHCSMMLVINCQKPGVGGRI